MTNIPIKCQCTIVQIHKLKLAVYNNNKLTCLVKGEIWFPVPLTQQVHRPMQDIDTTVNTTQTESSTGINLNNIYNTKLL